MALVSTHSARDLHRRSPSTTYLGETAILHEGHCALRVTELQKTFRHRGHKKDLILLHLHGNEAND